MVSCPGIPLGHGSRRRGQLSCDLNAAITAPLVADCKQNAVRRKLDKISPIQEDLGGAGGAQNAAATGSDRMDRT